MRAKSAKKTRSVFEFSAFFAVKYLCFLLLWPGLAKATVSFSPGFGQPGNLVTVTGSGFSSAATTNVFFNQQTLADFDIISSSQLLVVVPPGALSGPISVNGSNNSTSNFLVAPRLDSFTPETGASPLQIAISGANFANTTTVTFPGTNGSIVVTGTVVSVSQVTVTVPVGASNGPITVTTSAGSAVSADSFVSSNFPLITDFSPTVGTNGTSVLIHGANFISGTTIKFGAVSAAAPTIVSLTQLQVTVPAGAVTGAITVTNSHGGFTTSSNFTTGAKPIVTDFSPAYGKAGDSITVNGYNFSTATGLSFNGHGAAWTSQPSATQITIQVPSGATTGVITVTNTSGTGSSTNSFITGAGPVVTDFSPIFGAPGDSVIINGFNFTGLSGLKFNNTTAGATNTSDTQIYTTVPSGATNGPIKVTVGANTFTTSSNFNVTTGAPLITNCSPATGVRGQLITITGGNFANAVSAVKFNGVAAIFLTPTDPGTLQAYVPGAATSGPISVTTGSGTGVSAFNFYIQPHVDSFSPTNGIVNGTFAINGRNLTNALSVQVNGTSYLFSGTATQLVATIPTNATTGGVVVTTPAGSFIANSNFVILPKIYNFSPVIGPVGTVVTVNGTSLFNVSGVKFGPGTTAVPTVTGTNQLQVTVPVGATNGPLQVITPYGTDTSSNSFTFTSSSELILYETITPAVAILGQPVTYTLLLTNEGPSISTGVSIECGLSAAFTFISATSTMGTCVFTNNTVTNYIGVMTNNTSATLTIQTTASVLGSFTNSAFAAVAEPDIHADNNLVYGFVSVISDIQRKLKIQRLGNSALVSWPVSTVNFILQSSTNMASTNWAAPFASPGVVGTNNCYTNDLLNPHVFFRLKSP